MTDSHFRTTGLVCGHHHLYSSLARGMPAPPRVSHNFIGVLEDVWWRLDAALDLDIIYWSAALGAAEALLSGTTAIIDHHESPSAIEGSLRTIADACEMVGVRYNLAYGVTDRWSNGSLSSHVDPSSSMTHEARRGLQENDDYLSSGGRGMVGVHAAFTCSNETLEAAADLAKKHGTGVHIHVAEGPDDADAGQRLKNLAEENWLLVHGVYLDTPLKGFLAHNPRSNMNNSVGYATPSEKTNTIILGTDGIGADMLEEFRLSYVRHREYDITASPESSWQWLQNGRHFFPEVSNDEVIWNYPDVSSPWHVAFTPGIRAHTVSINGSHAVKDGELVSCDISEIRAKALEAARKLHGRL